MAYLLNRGKHPIIFCANYRTASTAVSRFLLEFGAEKQTRHHEPPKYVPKDAIVFQVVRNHFEVIYSGFHHWNERRKEAKQRHFTIDQYLDHVFSGSNPHLHPTSLYDKFDVNRELYYDSIDKELFELLLSNESIPYELIPKCIPRTYSTTPSEDFEKFVDKYGDRIYSQYEKEIIKYGFVFPDYLL